MTDLPEQIRAEAALADRPGQMQRLEALADEVETTLGRWAHLPRALQMANDRAERWKQRRDALMAKIERAEAHRVHCTAPSCCTEVLDGSD